MRISMIGSGYVGLVSGACFAELGFHVTCVDRDLHRIAELEAGRVPIFEPGLGALIEKQRRAGRLVFTTDTAHAVRSTDIIFIAVGTPPRVTDGHADLAYLLTAIDEIAPHLDGCKAIAIKSTVPVGTGRIVKQRLRSAAPTSDFVVCSNPEFLREGAAIADFLNPDRVLVGTDDPRAIAVMRQLYAPLIAKDVPVLFTAHASAELAKYAANAFLALKVSFINEMSDLCEQVGADVGELALAIGKDKRIGEQFLRPGPGFGGSCFPKDVLALIRTADEAGAPLSLVKQLQTVNEQRKVSMAHRLMAAMDHNVRGKTVGVLGVTFKANTDDMRGAPSLTILPLLLQHGARVVAFDPEGRRHAEPLLPGVDWAPDPMAVTAGADAVVVLTEWAAFKDLSLTAMKARMRGRLLADYRNVFDGHAARAAGFDYRGLGKPRDGIPSD